jgi:signal transduction histidine kinase
MSPTTAPETQDPVELVCHRLRTPLTAALGFLQLVLRDPGSERSREQLEMVDAQLRRMSAMLDELALARDQGSATSR